MLGLLTRTSRPTVWIPLLTTVGTAVLFHLTELDLAVSSLFFDKTTSSWLGLETEPWHSIYCFGYLPGLALGIGGLFIALIGQLWSPMCRYRKAGLFLALSLIIGPGILVNAILKPNWARPRPIQVRTFGGDSDFLAVGLIGTRSDSKSFPSGHAAMGFFLITPGFVLLRRNRRTAHAFFALGAGAGAIMGLTRIVQGGHFPSDVLAAGLIVYFTGLGLYFAMGFNRPMDDGEQRAESKKLRSNSGFQRAA